MAYRYQPLTVQSEDLQRLEHLKKSDRERYFYDLVTTNRLGITELDALQKAERAISGYRSDQLEENFIAGMWNFEHLKAVHKFLFNDIYYFAGKIRTMDMELDSVTRFCAARYIVSNGNALFAALKKDNYLRNMKRAEFIAKSARFLTDLNILHPFREGNGRCKRSFFLALARQAGYTVQYNRADNEQWLLADSAAFDNARDGKYNDEYLRVLLDMAITENNPQTL
jgi:cell filamentation protein